MNTWIRIPEWDFYEVSDDGQVRSQDRQIRTRWGTTFLRKGKVLKPISHRGYWAVTLREEGRNRTTKVHTLVLEAFVGPRPDGLEARHLDGNTDNNSLQNLKWGTRSENNLDRVAHGTHQNSSKLTCPRDHAYDYIDPKTGSRKCKRCRSMHMKAYYSRKRNKK
jgi:hypothetical protein